MGNKKITFSRAAPRSTSLEVYRDISLFAEPNQANLVKTYRQVIPMAYMASEVVNLKMSYPDTARVGKQTAYNHLSDFLLQANYMWLSGGQPAYLSNSLSTYEVGKWYVVERDPEFEESVYTLRAGEDQIELSAGSQFLVLSSFQPSAVDSKNAFETSVLVKDYGSLSGRLLQGEASSPSIPNAGVLLALQYADAYYTVDSYSNDICSIAVFLSGENDGRGQPDPDLKYVDDETRDKLMVLQDDGAVSTYAEWKEYKAWNPYKLSKLINVDAVYNSLRNLFTWQPGERILDPAYGSNLRQYLYQGITDITSEQIVAEIRSAIQTYEPRVRVEEVVDMTTAQDKENNTVQLDIVFSIPSLSREQFHYTYTWRQTD